MNSDAEKRARNEERSTRELERLLRERDEKNLPTRLIREELSAREKDSQLGQGDLSEHHWR